MVDKSTLGILLLVGAIVYAFAFTSAGSGISLPGLEKDGKTVQCQVEADYNSIHTATCNPVATCHTGLPFFLGIGEYDRKLNLHVGGQGYNQEGYEFTLGFNKVVQYGACVPASATQGEFIMTNAEGGIVARKAVSLGGSN